MKTFYRYFTCLILLNCSSDNFNEAPSTPLPISNKLLISASSEYEGITFSTERVYDSNNNLLETSITQVSGTVNKYEFEYEDGKPIKRLDYSNDIITKWVDILYDGDLISELHHLNPSTQEILLKYEFIYNDNNQLIEVSHLDDHNGSFEIVGNTTFEYENGMVSKITHPGNLYHKYEYDEKINPVINTNNIHLLAQINFGESFSLTNNITKKSTFISDTNELINEQVWTYEYDQDDFAIVKNYYNGDEYDYSVNFHYN